MWDTINPRGSSFGGMSRKKRNVKWPWFQQTTRELVFFLTRPCYRNFLDLCDSCEWPIGKQFRDGVFPFRRVFYSNGCPDCFIIRPAWRRRFRRCVFNTCNEWQLWTGRGRRQTIDFLLHSLFSDFAQLSSCIRSVTLTTESPSSKL